MAEVEASTFRSRGPHPYPTRSTWLRARGIQNEAVVRTMGRLPRERFVPPDMRGRAYDDTALPIEEEQTMVHPWSLARHRDVSPADQPDSRDGLVRGATRARGHQGHAFPRQASDAMDAHSLNSLGQRHRR